MKAANGISNSQQGMSNGQAESFDLQDRLIDTDLTSKL